MEPQGYMFLIRVCTRSVHGLRAIVRGCKIRSSLLPLILIIDLLGTRKRFTLQTRYLHWNTITK
ncbi:hypothetical protein IFM89_021758 [Coptis chinensis]|uniref:Uncharacterized protein n=1 Tax=Coptis chinensis TaxID=261450 RepID=A0A835H5N4_9MAGN|nr:hypothetical protein IFM89_021758 [Coptis chinensis]